MRILPPSSGILNTAPAHFAHPRPTRHIPLMRSPSTFPVLPATSGMRATPAFVLSAALHGLAVVLVIAGSRMERSVEAAPRSDARVRMVELPPMPVEATRVPLPPRSLTPVPARRVPRPQVARGAPMPEELSVRAEPEPDRPDDQPPLATAPEPPASAPVPSPPTTPVDVAAARATEMRSEAQRLFGPRRLGSDRQPGPVSASWVNQLTDDRPNDCTPTPRPPRDPSAPLELGTVSGRVFRAGTSQPLPGAFLQILGTPYSTFADDEGDYTLQFDRSLVDDCRTQYVQVSKDGFAPQRLILSLGSRTSNDIPLQRR